MTGILRHPAIRRRQQAGTPWRGGGQDCDNIRISAGGRYNGDTEEGEHIFRYNARELEAPIAGLQHRLLLGNV